MNFKNNLLYCISAIPFILFSQITDPQDALQKHKQSLLENVVNHHKINSEQIRKFDAVYYDLNLQVEYDPDLLKGEVTGVFVSQEDFLSEIYLDFDDRMQVISVSGNAVSYTHSAQQLDLVLDREYQSGQSFEITVKYQGIPGEGTSFNYFRFDQMDDGSPYVWTLSEPHGARYWWPCKDTPQDKADSVNITVTVPDGQRVASNGVLKSVLQNNDQTVSYFWSERYPIATYLVSIAAGNYAQFQEYYMLAPGDSMLLDYYVFPSKLEIASEAFSEMSDYLDALSYYFGPYPFLDEKYGMVQFGWGGGMEHQTMTSIGRVTSQWRYVYVHELGHQWFGDAVTCNSWQEIWLNEGFASYSEALYAEWAGYDGNPPGKESLHAYMETQQFTEGGTIIREDTTRFSGLFGLIVYDKGSWVLHMLRKVVGDEDFFRILKTYVNDARWSYGSVTTDNFVEICESISGKSLQVFFDQWLRFPFYPQYAYSWQTNKNAMDEYDIDFKIQQRQNTVVYEMPVDIMFTFEDGTDTTFTVLNDRSVQNYFLQFRKEPTQIKFDPQNWILKQADEYESEQFTKDIVLENFYPNPFSNEVTIIVSNWYNEKIGLDIYDVNGRKINSLTPLISTNRHSFEFRWDGRKNNNEQVASGVYFVVPSGNNTSAKFAKKLIKIR